MGGVCYHVALAFGVGSGGALAPVVERAAEDPLAAVGLARRLASTHAGAVAFSRTMDLERGRYGPAQVHFVGGKIPRDLLILCGLEPTSARPAPRYGSDRDGLAFSPAAPTSPGIFQASVWQR
jgi:hypothetical protein